MALELDDKSWKLAFGTGLGERARERTVAVRDGRGVLEEIERAKQRYGLAADPRVVSCYEAGREGFWLHRFLVAHGIENVVIDASSIEVNRRSRRPKTDRLDASRLLERLIKYTAGSKEWRVVRVPSVDEEDARQEHRELETIKAERTAVSNRIKGLMATQGLKVPVTQRFAEELDGLRLWDGSSVPPQLRARLLREWEHWRMLTDRQREVEAIRRRALQERKTTDGAIGQVDQLRQLRSIGVESATLLIHEIFSWREIRNRRQLGALGGMTPTPYSSGGTHRELGISKAGNARVRRCMLELSWLWLRYQPDSALSKWFEERFGTGGKRQRKIGIVALARKLLIALWRYLDQGIVPEGASLKA